MLNKQHTEQRAEQIAELVADQVLDNIALRAASMAAEGLAQHVADREREHQRISEAEQATGDAREEITEIRGHVHRLIIAIRNHDHVLPEILCRELREDVRRYHHAMHVAIRTIHDNQGELIT